MSRSRIRLSSRDRQIIDDVARHRIMTNQVLHHRHFTGLRPNAVTKVTARLCRAGMLNKFMLYHPRAYYTLGTDGAQLLGISIHRTYPLGPQSLPTEYAALVYATLGDPPHRRMTSAELSQLCPWLSAPLNESPYCLDDSVDPPLLEVLRVDLGGKPDHVARKCIEDLRERLAIPDFREHVRQGRFRLVIMTATTAKAAAIQAALEGRVWPDGLSIHLAVVPDLLQLTARLSHGT